MKNLIKGALGALVLCAAAYTNPAMASLTSLGTDDNGFLLIYDNVNNITWYDRVYIDTGTALNVTKTLAGTTGWQLPAIGQLTTLHTQLGLTLANYSNPAKWAPFGTEPNPDSDFLGSLPDYGTQGYTFVSSTVLSGKLERETLGTGIISTGTSSSLTGAGLYEHAGLVPVPEPTTMLAGAMMLLPFGASALRFLRKNRTA